MLGPSLLPLQYDSHFRGTAKFSVRLWASVQVRARFGETIKGRRGWFSVQVYVNSKGLANI